MNINRRIVPDRFERVHDVLFPRVIGAEKSQLSRASGLVTETARKSKLRLVQGPRDCAKQPFR